MQMNDLDFVEFLERHKNKEAISFHMPGHKGTRFFKANGYDKFFRDIASADITEIDGADNLFKPQGIIKNIMSQYRELYGSRASYLLVNGSSSGIEAAILSCVKRGGKLILARNSHKSVYNAIEIGNIEPIYAMPQIDENYGIVGAITSEEIDRLLAAHEDADAVIIPSPNYYGICSDIAKIASSCHAHGKILIVDEAHGAHLKFFARKEFQAPQEQGSAALAFPQAAEDAGADIVIVSTHKTLASFTQSAVLNVMTNRVDLDALCGRLAQFTSTSPSYLLMASLAINAKLLLENRDALMRKWEENLDFFYENVRKIQWLKVIEEAGRSKNGYQLFDKSKLNIDMSQYGYDGYALQQALIEYGIYTELASGNIVMCMTGIGNERSDYEKLLAALSDISKVRQTKINQTRIELRKSVIAELPERIDIAKMRKTRVNIKEAAGKASAVNIIPYPPGSPIICSGEIITKEMVEYILSLVNAGENLVGPDENLDIFCYI